MNTPTISAAPPVAPGNTGRTQNSGGSEPESATPFSTILTRQRGAEPSRAAPAAANSQDSAVEGKNPTDKKGHAADKDAIAKEGDEALAQAAGEQGLTLPQIALTIAAEAAAVQKSSHTAKVADTAGLRTLAAPEHPATAHDGKAALKPALATDLAASRAAADVSAIARNASAAQQPVQDLAANPLAAAIPASLPAAPAATAPQATLLGANKAASLAGARQAVLTMQARAQASGDGQIKLVLPEVSAAMASAARHAAPDTGMIAGSTELAAAQIASLAAGHSASAGTLPANGSALLAGLGLQTTHSAIGAPLQSPQWASELGRQFVSITQGGHNMPHTAELRLDPPELGPLRITINISDNVAHAVFVSPHAGVRQAVENAMSQLQQSLAQAGISLGQTSVSDQGQPQQAFNESFGNSRREAAGGGAVGAAGLDGGAAQPAARSRAPDALVDTFA